MELLYNISEIAIITGDNPYKTKREYLIDFWKKNAKDDYNKYVQLTSFVKENDKEIIDKITKNNKINIKKELYQCTSSKDIISFNLVKKEIFDKIEGLDEEDKKNITKSLHNVTNTKFGIRNENDITKIYEKITGNSILKDNKYRKILLFENEKYKIIIGGKIDGINNENGNIIEIKNRINKLFYELRNYEKVQIMCYMYLFQTKKGHLVESHKKENNPNINIIEVLYDQDYMQYIFNALVKFSDYYLYFMNNHQEKINLLKNENEIIF